MIKSKLPLILIFLIFFLSPIINAQSNLYWEEPELFSTGQGNFPISAFNEDFGIIVWQEPTRRPVSGPAGTGDGSINIALAVKLPGEPWVKRGIIGGPYIYSGAEPSILTAIVDKNNRILVASAASASQTEIMISDDFGVSFDRYRLNSGTQSSLAPKIAVCSDGSYLLFITRGEESSLSLYYSRSSDGRNWGPFQRFVTEPGMLLTFLPWHVSFGGREYVVFQSFTGSSETIPTFQLFFKISNDNGRSWSPSKRFTNFRDTYANTAASADNFDNQRPHHSVQDNSLFLV